MCSQPPREIDDDWHLDEAFELIRLLPPSTSDICFTGGEPTLYGEGLIRLLALCRNLIPHAEIHVLTNGRRFRDMDFAKAWAAIGHRGLMAGIPIYGPEPSLHDYVVQSAGAFDETVRGILNLAQLGQRIEIRVVLHKQTAPVIVEIAEFISRNLPFVEQVALMGLETIGLARAHIEDVWIDPYDYRDLLADAVVLLDRKGIRTMVYNLPLCLIDRDLWPFAVKSISDWKNEYHPECLSCSVLDRCGGFFFSAKYRLSDHIRAIGPEVRGLGKQLLSLADTQRNG
jgi:His-Xaa-Ser system radical SAM maturase HxsC